MNRETGKPKAETDSESERRKEKIHLNDVLDEGLEETFPASDPPSVLTPGQRIRRGDDKKR